jgi:hypothetical protein
MLRSAEESSRKRRVAWQCLKREGEAAAEPEADTGVRVGRSIALPRPDIKVRTRPFDSNPSLAYSPAAADSPPASSAARLTQISSLSFRANTHFSANAGCDHTVIRRMIGCVGSMSIDRLSSR